MGVIAIEIMITEVALEALEKTTEIPMLETSVTEVVEAVVVNRSGLMAVVPVSNSDPQVHAHTRDVIEQTTEMKPTSYSNLVRSQWALKPKHRPLEVSGQYMKVQTPNQQSEANLTHRSLS